ncbi:hypothetical protein LV82_02105 [Albidovulum inexpectatum]|uniref:Uncharacterized protein n=2 Tax=Albidovulum inexpectatum TaxID=196587 RepID=A0A2S5JFQ9_9RHOB|nr:hypothetical protein LV82_02105 [Albidovulum inexpectatum]
MDSARGAVDETIGEQLTGMNDERNDQILARITPSVPRRLFALGVLGALGFLLVYLAFSIPSGSGLVSGMLVVFGVLALVLCVRMYRATARSLILTQDELRDSEGTVIARLQDVERVERGAFAFKPSNGFLLHLTTSHSRRWEPGLWWRLGRRVGVGGTISGAEGRNMADLLSVALQQRQANDPG